LFCPQSVSGGTGIKRMNFLPAVPACHVAAFREGESVAASFACQTINHLQARTPARPTNKMSVLRLFPPRRSSAKAGVLRAVPLSAHDELVRRMKSELALQFSPEPIDEPIFLK
jgi:hypothetical protein